MPVNRTITVYDKENVNFAIKDAVVEDRVLAYDKKRINTVAHPSEVQFLSHMDSVYYNNNINNFWGNFKYETTKKSILITDLINEWENEQIIKAGIDDDNVPSSDPIIEETRVRKKI